jgi:predicted PurR-regulated permease PerM
MTPGRRYALFLGITFAIALALVIAAHSVILPFILAAVIAYVLTPLVARVEAKRVPRALAIVLVYVVVLGTIGTFVRIVAPRVVYELASLRHELPSVAQTIRTEWVPAVQKRMHAMGLSTAPPPQEPPRQEVPSFVAKPLPDGAFAVEIHGPIEVVPRRSGGYVIEPMHESKPEPFDLDKLVADTTSKTIAYAQQNALEVVKLGRNIIAGVSRVFFVFGLTLMLAAYTMLTRERIGRFFSSLLRPDMRPSAEALLARIDRGLSGVVRGQLVICLVNGVLSAIGFAIVGLKYWPVLALVATVLSLIPIFGSIVSAIPAVALGLTQSFGTAVFVLLWIVGIHQLEANLLNPKIMGDAAKIHPLLVIFSLLFGEHYFGVVGALLAVPAMSIAQSVFIHVRQHLQAADPEMAHEPVGSLPPPPPT